MKKNYVYIVTGAVALVILIIILVKVFGSAVNTPSISIPSPDSQENGEGGGRAEHLNVDIESVQALVASIDRPDAYSRGYQVFTYWQGGQAEALITVHQKNDSLLILHSQDKVSKNTLITDGEIHVWYDGSSKVSSAKLKDYSPDRFDWYARLIVYEDLLNIPQKDILDAGYETMLEENCVFVEYQYSEKYVYRLHISVDKGLLIAATAFEDGVKIYELKSVYTDISVPSDNLFQPPA